MPYCLLPINMGFIARCLVHTIDTADFVITNHNTERGSLKKYNQAGRWKKYTISLLDRHLTFVIR
jgi:hypothetical protein